MMAASFVLIKKDGQRRAFPLAAGITIIGRHPNCDLRIPLMDISRRHCQIDCHGGLFSLRDLGSANGTFVNGERVEETQLKPGDHIQIGQVTFMLEVGVATEPKTPEKPAVKPAESSPAKPVNQISDDDFFASIGNIEDLKSGSATEFPAEP
jgi:pSer/pThr/pTyr-binding forkhead associated (FHA) protein